MYSTGESEEIGCAADAADAGDRQRAVLMRIKATMNTKIPDRHQYRNVIGIEKLPPLNMTDGRFFSLITLGRTFHYNEL